ncbi:MAG: DNA polymerase III subunit beta [Chlamydiia bacterium]|nr:DNA polymerase III subunit beta [Chlamydiia bacterium]
MKFVVSKQELIELIRKIQNVVPQNAPVPILSHFLIEASGDELVFTATDLTVGTRVYLPAKVQEKGAVSLPSRRFFQLIKELNDSNIEITSGPGQMTEIKTGTSCFHLHGMDKTEYPDLPDLSEAIQFKISGQLLKEMLFRTSFAVPKEDNRYVLTGVLMRIKEGKVIFVGTDGKRLSKTEAEISMPFDYTSESILPLKAVDEMIKTFNDEGEATVFLTHDKVAVESGNGILVTKLLSGDYPDFEQVIATETKIPITLHREELISLLKQISLFTNDSFQSARFTFVSGELILTANTADIGDGKVSMPVNYDGPKFEIAFHPHFFLDILRHTKDETVTLGISDSYNPGIITDSTSSLFVIMPMRLSDHFSIPL